MGNGLLPGRKVAGVIGWPVAHSLSPKLHGYWLKKYAIEGQYKALPVASQDLATCIRTLAEDKSWRGFNLTLPHKELVLPLLDTIDAAAKAIGAVNTVVVSGGKLHGSNTDIYGFSQNITPHLPGRREKAVILGAGGATRAVAKALIDLGFGTIIIANRTRDKAEAIRRQIGHDLEISGWEERSELLAGAALLVNATSLGMEGKEPLDIDLALLPGHALVTDIVYTPLVTPLQEKAKARGNPVVDGLGMLLHQAVPGFEAWFGVRPEVDEELRHYMTGA